MILPGRGAAWETIPATAESALRQGVPANLFSQIAFVLMFGGCLAAGLAAKGRPRVAAIALACAMVLSLQAQTFTNSWAPTLLLGLIDVTLLGVFFAVAWRSAQAWPVVLVGLQGLVVAVDGVKLLQPRVQAYAYASVVILVSYGLVITLLYGAWATRRRQDTRPPRP